MNNPYFVWNLSQLPGGQWDRARDQKRYYDDYLRLNQMTWYDVKYPALLHGTSYVGAAFQTIGDTKRAITDSMTAFSKNMEWFYRNR